MSDIVFRSIERNDVQELKDLHTECFPVHYDDIFFENICFGKGFKNAALYTLVGVEVESSRIVGCILGQFVKSKKCEDLGLFSELSDQARDVFYILTLGLRQEYRRSGLGEWFSVQSLFTFFIIFHHFWSLYQFSHSSPFYSPFRPFPTVSLVFFMVFYMFFFILFFLLFLMLFFCCFVLFFLFNVFIWFTSVRSSAVAFVYMRIRTCVFMSMYVCPYACVCMLMIVSVNGWVEVCLFSSFDLT